ncbi:aldolase [Archangium violaceum]|uniref:class I fructose-bisphosphate aldolase n=1 Tax=Archangium violaceum TaxID=83451 RepID=UPI0019526F26|nr:aldolase [Archangium violaceum]QRN93226.1 aldolase [Archangium violaceum]
MNTAKKVRLGKILGASSQRAVIVPIDHGLTMGPLTGIESTARIARWIGHPGVDAVLAHKGILSRLADQGALDRKGVILHLNGMSNLSDSVDDKEWLTSIETALLLGADAVSLQVNFNGRNDRANWKMLGQAVDGAARYGLPVLTMLYDKVGEEPRRLHRLKQLMRTAVELGTDALKIGMSERPELLREALEDVQSDALVFVAGGELTGDEPLLEHVSNALRAGARGVCIGRNIFVKKSPALLLERLSELVHGEPARGEREVALASVR